MKSQLRIIDDKIIKKKKGITNSLKAYEGIIPDAPTDSFKSKKMKSNTANASATKDTSKSAKKSSTGSSPASNKKMKPSANSNKKRKLK